MDHEEVKRTQALDQEIIEEIEYSGWLDGDSDSDNEFDPIQPALMQFYLEDRYTYEGERFDFENLTIGGTKIG